MNGIKEKYLGFFATVFLLLSAGTGMAGDQCAAPHARIVCKSPSYDFGTAKGRKTVKHTFLIENTGITPLEIKEVKACCGLKASCTTNRIDPQGTAEVAVSFPLLGRSGAQNKVIKVFSSDPHTPEYHLTMRGQVELGVSADVRRIDFGLMKPGGTAVTNLTVRGVSPDSVFIAVSNSCFSVEQKTVESNRVTFCVKAVSGPLPCVMNEIV